MAERFLRMTRKWLEGAAGLRRETVTQSFAKSTDQRADELISGSLSISSNYNSFAKAEPPINSFKIELFGIASSSKGSMRCSSLSRRQAV